jgi:hypothetical protein
MEKSKLNIPTTIKVGFQTRQDTYTKKLAYIIYYDIKTNKLRKEYSWEQWRDKVIEPIEYTNEPISGFVLNKEAGGGYSSRSWHKRNTYIRIYDPRGFEFEISVDNLLFILQETNSIKGKGLEGEFIYSWSGKDIVLLPTSCKEYTDSLLFTSKQVKKISAKEIVKGYTYLDKNLNHLVYIGRYNYTDPRNEGTWRPDWRRLDLPTYALRHIFYNLSTEEFIGLPGFTSLAEIVSNEVHVNYAEYYQQYITNERNYKLVNIKLAEVVKEEEQPLAKFILLENTWYFSNAYYKPITYLDKNYLAIYSCNNIPAPTQLVFTPEEFAEWVNTFKGSYRWSQHGLGSDRDISVDLLNKAYKIVYTINVNGEIKDI